MAKRIISSLAAVLVSASLSLGQAPTGGTTPPPADPPQGPAAAPAGPGGPAIPAMPADPCARIPGACAPAEAPAADGWDFRGAPGPRVWGSAEYLLWWMNGTSVPPLVTTGPAQFPVGFLGAPGTQVLFGGSSLSPNAFSGARFMAGTWLGDCRQWGIEGNYFFLGQQSTSANFNSATTPVLTRPFTNGNSGEPFSEFAAFPGISTGGIAINAPTNLWGAGVLLRRPLCCGCWYNVDLLGGFQFLSLRESLTVTESATFLPGGPFPGLAGQSFVATDEFATRNRFYGGQVGLVTRLYRGNWVLGLRALIGLGSTHQEIDIQGSQRITSAAGQVTTVPGGLLALPGANIGHHERDVFSVVPQIGLNLGYRVTERITLFGGYNLLYWSNVVRPGEQIDPVLDVNRIPNFVKDPRQVVPPRPSVPFKSSDLWLHGVSFGVGLNW